MALSIPIPALPRDGHIARTPCHVR